MISRETLLLTRTDVSALLRLDDCISAVEAAFRKYALGEVPVPGVLGFPAHDGGFHLKAASLPLGRNYFAVKCNGNFFHNAERFRMPRIQGLILLCDADNGFPLAVMDSTEITMLRTGAATAVAAKYLARVDAHVATICGCGVQGRVQLQALSRVRALTAVHAFDVDPAQSERFAEALSRELGMAVQPAGNLASAVRASDICVTCTPSREALIQRDDVKPGAFVAGVGSDSPEKQELDSALLAASRVVTDVTEQCVAIGDLHHAIARGIMAREDVHAELGEVVCGRKPGRTRPEEIFVFDSTGTALQDVAAAAVAYERALEAGAGAKLALLT